MPTNDDRRNFRDTVLNNLVALDAAHALGFQRAPRGGHPFICPACGSGGKSGRDSDSAFATPNVRGKRARCYSCDADIIDAVRAHRGESYNEALATLAGLAGLAVPDWLDGSDDPPRARRRPGRRRTAPTSSRPKPPAVRPATPGPVVTDERVAVMRAIWRVVDTAQLGDDLDGWRGIRADTLDAAGCRDWRPVVNELRAVLAGFSLEHKAAAGLYQLDRDGGSPRPWYALATTMRDPSSRRAAGVFLPCWMPGHTAPVAWRWRPLERAERGPKCSAQYGAPYPLGFVTPHGSGLCGAASAPIVIVAEGEPDWLAFLDVLAPTPLSARVGVLGMTAVAGGWCADWTDAIAGAQRVIVAVHQDDGDTEDKTGRDLVGQIFVELSARIGAQAALERMVRCPVPGSRDANDMHCAGELGRFIADRLGTIDHDPQQEAAHG